MILRYIQYMVWKGRKSVSLSAEVQRREWCPICSIGVVHWGHARIQWEGGDDVTLFSYMYSILHNLSHSSPHTNFIRGRIWLWSVEADFCFPCLQTFLDLSNTGRENQLQRSQTLSDCLLWNSGSSLNSCHTLDNTWVFTEVAHSLRSQYQEEIALVQRRRSLWKVV